jgi:predicted AlkP superfamily pyrophosphatase or phosphodiesterase
MLKIPGHIFGELLQPNWSMLIAHCLGVDHAGHRYGPAHPEMRRKLRQMDNLILRLTETMPDDAILFVLGDHGMTLTGDHGGDSFEELASALFVYTKKKEGFSAERNEMMDEQQQTCQTTTNKKRTFLQVLNFV